MALVMTLASPADRAPAVMEGLAKRGCDQAVPDLQTIHSKRLRKVTPFPCGCFLSHSAETRYNKSIVRAFHLDAFSHVYDRAKILLRRRKPSLPEGVRLTSPTEQEERMPAAEIVKNIHWLGHDSICVEGSVRVFFDPFRISASKKADIILISHDHFDHCSPEDVAKIRGKDTVIVTTEEAARKFEGDVRIVSPGDRLQIRGVDIEAWPAYNTDKEFHPKEANMVSFVVTLDGVRYYHAGDTDLISEMSDLKVDVAFLPVSGTYVMTAEEAVEAAKVIRPKVAIPMHYAAIVGTEDDALRFKKALDGVLAAVVLAKESL